MIIQSVSKVPTSTRVALLDVPEGTSDREILAACGPAPRGYIGDHTIRRYEDFSGEVTRYGASVTFWTD